MKPITTALLLIAPILPSFALADGCPAGSGSWSNLTGMDPGRAVVSNCGGGGLQVGDMMAGASWDGTDVGAQWSVPGIELASVVIDDSGINPDGSGVRVAHTTYTGGTFTLAPDGPWGSAPGSTDPITGVMSSGSGTVSIYRIAGGIQTSVISTVTGTGHIDSCDGNEACLVSYSFGQSQVVWQGDPATDNPLADFPAFEDCSGSAPPMASQWVMSTVGFALDCPVNNDDVTWSGLKAQFR